MCGRFSLVAVSTVISDRFKVRIDEPMAPRYNIAPGQNVSVIMNTDKEKVQMLRWGLIPHWAKDKNIGYKMINARAETLLERNAYKGPIKTKRCLIPADGFYEWKKVGSDKIPYRITLEDNGLFAFAGIYDYWEAEDIYSFSIITVEPNNTVNSIHDRMPAILLPDHELLWLDETPAEIVINKALNPYPGKMKSYQVSSLINSPSNNTPDVMKPDKTPTLLDF